MSEIVRKTDIDVWAVTLGSLFIWIETQGILGSTLQANLSLLGGTLQQYAKNYEPCNSPRWSGGVFLVHCALVCLMEEVWTLENQILSLLSPGARPGQPTEGFCSLWGAGSGLSPVFEHGLPSYQGKTVIQAEIDAAAELIDFFRFNAQFAMELEGEQPISVPPSTNHVVYRGLEVLQGR